MTVEPSGSPKQGRDSFEAAASVEFVEQTDVTEADAGASLFRADVPEGWNQGRGAFGGLVVGLMCNALEQVEGTGNPLRALTAEIPAPVLVGPTEVKVTTLRRGRSLSSHEAHLLQEGKVLARATAIFGASRESAKDVQMTVPRLPARPFDAVTPIPESAPAATFARHFEFRPTGPMPFSAGPEAVVEGWVRLRGDVSDADPARMANAAEVAALADSYWPAFFSVSKAPRPAATIAYTLHTTPAASSLPVGTPVYYRATCRQAGDGYCFEERRVFAPDGTLLAINPQTFAIIK